MNIDPTSLHRHSSQLKEYDYASPGAYFVTMVTNQRDCILGEVVNGEIRLSEFGEIVKEEWFRTVILRSYIRLYPYEFVVMPNHAH